MKFCLLFMRWAERVGNLSHPEATALLRKQDTGWKQSGAAAQGTFQYQPSGN